jgi:hypothetical protein
VRGSEKEGAHPGEQSPPSSTAGTDTGTPPTDTGGDPSTAPPVTTPPVPSPRLAGYYTPLDAFAEIDGAAGSAPVGFTVASAGDLDADGYSDLLLGVTADSAVADGSGAVFAFSGPVSGVTDVSSAVGILTGENSGDNAGWVVASAGDVNGDGFDDVLGQTHRFDEPFDDGGLAFVAFGPVAGAHLATDADVVLRAAREGEGFGLWTAGIGDSSGDGTDDVAIGSSLLAPGAVYLFDDSLVAGDWSETVADAVLTGDPDGVGAGDRLATLGDVDGDGLADLLVSDIWRDGGTVYLARAPFLGDSRLGDASGAVHGYGGEFLGMNLGAGDLDGDGLPDPLVESYSPNDTFVFSGWRSGATATANATASISLTADAQGGVTSPGDLDGDGFDELLLGCGFAEAPSLRGSAWLYYGPVVGALTDANADASFGATGPGDEVGTAVAGAGDIDGDGVLDLAITAVGAAGDLGAAYLFSGRP